MAKKDVSGKRFGLLTVGEYVGRSTWICVCDCGATTTRATSELTKSKTPSCGCAKAAILTASLTTHGASRSPLYKVYTEMKGRCNNPANKKYHLYGARGIKVCARWAASFESFAEDMGERPQGMSIERINGNLGYSKDNCKWATSTEQNRNLSTNVLSPGVAQLMRLLRAGGHSISEVSRLTKTSYQNAYDVLVRNYWAVKP